MGGASATRESDHDPHDGHDHEGHGHGHGRAHEKAAPKEAHGHGAHGHGHGFSLVGLPDMQRARRALLIALVLTLCFAGVEVTVGLLDGSLALVADAAHMLGDALALAGSAFVASLALRPRSFQNTFGFRRAEVLAAVGNAALLLMGSLWVVREAIERLGAPLHVEGRALFITAAVGLLVNLVAALVLARASRGSLNVRAALFHVLGDAVGSLAALLAGAVVVIFGWRLADPIASIAIAVLLGYGGVRLLRESAGVLMEAAPPHVDTRALERTIAESLGVASVHDLHVWAITPDTPLLTVHVVLQPGVHGTDVVRCVTTRLHEIHGITHATVQPETPDAPLVQLRAKPKA